jgi:hypothetical protein
MRHRLLSVDSDSCCFCRWSRNICIWFPLCGTQFVCLNLFAELISSTIDATSLVIDGGFPAQFSPASIS